MARTSPVIELKEREREKLELIARRPRTSQRDAMRAKIVLRAADGMNNREIVTDLGVNKDTVGKWRTRYSVSGIQGLVDAPRPGPPRTVSDAKVEEIITRTLESVPEGRTHWSRRTMAKEADVSTDTVGRIWHAFGLKPHRVDTFKLSTDPMFVEKVVDVIGLYLDPPANAMVLCVDEKSQCQALERSQPVLPMTVGSCEKQTSDYQRHGTTSLFAALDTATGRVIGKCHRRHRHQEFLRFLAHLEKELPDDADIHVIMDNYATHKTPKVVRWFARRPRWHAHFTPTGGSWLNQIERWFGMITEQAIRRGSFTSVPALEKAIYEYIEVYQKNPRPFAWTATANSIFEKISSKFDKPRN